MDITPITPTSITLTHATTTSGLSGVPVDVSLAELVITSARTNTSVSGTPSYNIPLLATRIFGISGSSVSFNTGIPSSPISTSSATLKIVLPTKVVQATSVSTGFNEPKNYIIGTSSASGGAIFNAIRFGTCLPVESTSDSSAKLSKFAVLSHTINGTSSQTSHIKTVLPAHTMSAISTSGISGGVIITTSIPRPYVQIGSSSAALELPLFVLFPSDVQIGESSVSLPQELLIIAHVRGTANVTASAVAHRRTVTISGILLDAFNEILPNVPISVQLNSANGAQIQGNQGIDISFLPATAFTNIDGEFNLTLVAPQDLGSGYTYTIIFDALSVSPIVQTTISFAYTSSTLILSSVVDTSLDIPGAPVSGTILGPYANKLSRRSVLAYPLVNGIDSATNEPIDMFFGTVTNTGGQYILYLPPSSRITTIDGSVLQYRIYANSPTISNLIEVTTEGGNINALTVQGPRRTTHALTFDKVGADNSGSISSTVIGGGSTLVDSLARIRSSLVSLAGQPDWPTLLGGTEYFALLNNSNTPAGDANISGTYTTGSIQAQSIYYTPLPIILNASASGHIRFNSTPQCTLNTNTPTTMSDMMGFMQLELSSSTGNVSGSLCSVIFSNLITYTAPNALSIYITPYDTATAALFISGQIYATINVSGFSLFLGASVHFTNPILSLSYVIEGN